MSADIETFEAHAFSTTEVRLKNPLDIKGFFQAVCIDEQPVIVSVDGVTASTPKGSTLVMPSMIAARIRSGEFIITAGEEA